MAQRTSLDHLGRDVLLTAAFQGDDWSGFDLVSRPRERLYPDEIADLDRAQGGNCLRQALVLRLLTPRGSLAELGHAEYGSELHRLIGAENTSQTRLLARAYALRAILQERRVAQVLSLTVTPDAAQPHVIHIRAAVQPTQSDDALLLGLEVAL